MLLARHRPIISKFLTRSPRVITFNLFPLSQSTRAANMSDKKDVITESLDATKADYVRLGNTGLKVSIPIFGTMSFGDKRWAPWVIEEEEALPLLKAAFDRGLTTWDTANLYSNGVCEEIIGKAIKKYNIPRHKLFIFTKCFFEIGENPGDPTMAHMDIIKKTKDYVNQGGLSRGAIFRAVDASLKRLGTDYVDMLQIHRFDNNTPIEETMEALHDLVRSGKVHYIGASSMWATQFARMQECAEKHGWTKFVSMQNRYSLVYREEEREMIRYCNDTGVGIIPWAPLEAGMLARPADQHGSTTRSKGKSLPSEMHEEIVKRVQETAEKKGWKMTHVALAWIKAKVTSPIVGFSSVARLDEALDVRGKELTAEEIKYLEEPYKPQAIIGHG